MLWNNMGECPRVTWNGCLAVYSFLGVGWGHNSDSCRDSPLLFCQGHSPSHTSSAEGTPPATHSPNPRLQGGQWSGGRCGGPCSEPEIDSNYCYYYYIILLAAFERGGGFRKAVGSMPLEAALWCPYPSGCRKTAALVRHDVLKPFRN